MASDELSNTSEAELRVQRLSWAGVKLELGDQTLLIDPLGNSDLWGGPFAGALVPIEVVTPACSALVTHLHQDHFDPGTLARTLSPSGQVLCAADVAATVGAHGLGVRPVRLFEPHEVGGFHVVAVPAVDGFGITQVSWVVIADGWRLIHCGDTLWHGAWWDIATVYGPFHVAFLPINGFRWHGREPDVDVPTSLTPEQAVAAAAILRTSLLVPIHYGIEAPFYSEEPDAASRVAAAAAVVGVTVAPISAGEALPM